MPPPTQREVNRFEMEGANVVVIRGLWVLSTAVCLLP